MGRGVALGLGTGDGAGHREGRRAEAQRPWPGMGKVRQEACWPIPGVFWRARTRNIQFTKSGWARLSFISRMRNASAWLKGLLASVPHHLRGSLCHVLGLVSRAQRCSCCREGRRFLRNKASTLALLGKEAMTFPWPSEESAKNSAHYGSLKQIWRQ